MGLMNVGLWSICISQKKKKKFIMISEMVALFVKRLMIWLISLQVEGRIYTAS